MLSNGLMFVVESGEMEGVYAFDTRFLKDLNLEIKGLKLIDERKEGFKKDVLYYLGDSNVVAIRERTLKERAYVESLSIYNSSSNYIRLKVSYSFKVPMEDIFEVRGFGGVKIRRRIIREGNIYRYVGIDGVERRLKVRSNMEIRKYSLEREINLAPFSFIRLYVEFRPKISYKVPFEPGEKLERKFISNSRLLNRIVNKALKELEALTLKTKLGKIAIAGLPYFGTIFGRDCIITALFLLPWYPEYAKGTLKFLSGKHSIQEMRKNQGKFPMKSDMENYPSLEGFPSHPTMEQSMQLLYT
ncbi:glycogen debranching N-terminal domain-containing protein [Pyrococcus sp. NA2]|uniref:glycogen debranching N-terminal domain-containing protein n=1 Tax=Pyrococcus sp. (strain NA2) TaxID=342949 RepID=UPI000A6CA843|nr:glycogen debranching N-terminal domain-containing protein [Pyrococcus sp. NA2]